ncbi:hypothetical protein C8Q74DRAFT_13249 [Fomes fomentarius]|nr:hypothetical protein C8Q74DRAFT_13249 [Fomes fomentarius]
MSDLHSQFRSSVTCADYTEQPPSLDNYLCAEDEVAIRELDSSRVQVWAWEKLEEYAKRIRGIKTLYNAAAPINRTLPAEMLMEVFSKLRPGEPGAKRVLSCLHVCRLWRLLLLRTPDFWVEFLKRPRHISDLKTLEIHIGLTRTLPITLVFHGFPSYILPKLYPHAHRLAMLVVRIRVLADAESLDTLMKGCTPSLRSLSVMHDSFCAMNKPPFISLHLEHLPQLRSLRHPCQFLAIASIASQLRHLALFRCSCSTCYALHRTSTDSLPQILERCILLESLRVQGAIPLFPEHRERPVHLPALRELHITDSNCDLPHLFAHVVLPRTCVVDIVSWEKVPFQRFLPSELSTFIQASQVNEVCFLHPRVRSSAKLEMYTEGARRLCVQQRTPPSFAQSLASIRRSFSSSNIIVTALTISIINYGQTNEFYLLLHHFLQLRSLRIGQFDGRPLLHLLGEENRSSAGACLCPRLEELHLVWRYSEDEVFAPAEWGQGEGRQWHLSGPAVFASFCDSVAYMLQRRISAGSPLKKLSVGVLQGVESHYDDQERWDPPSLRERLSKRFTIALGDVDAVYVDDVVVDDDDDDDDEP